jgi:transposase
MVAIACELSESSAPRSNAKPTPFEQTLVTLTKQAHIELVTQANYWRWAHGRALERLEGQAAHYREQLDQAQQRAAALRAALQTAQAKIRDLRRRVFGGKTERTRTIDTRLGHDEVSSRPRGQQPGAAGHARTPLSELPAHVETIEIDAAQCPECGAPLVEFPGTEDCQIVEIAVRAYRRLIRRRRYRASCRCGCVPGIVAAAPPPRLIERGKFGISVWVSVLLDKFLYGRPSYRLVADWADHGLKLSAGTLTGGLKSLAPLFEPLEQALLAKLRSQTHWHADETRWPVFVDIEGKLGHRWYLWVFHSPSVVHYVLDPSRSAAVPLAELAGVQGDVISCDRYAGYKKFAREHPGFMLAYCWAHQRRDLLELANAYPALWDWAMVWVECIGELYRLHAERGLAAPAVKVMQSMKKHWPGLTVFLEQAHLPMDNNTAERALRPAVVARKNFYGSGSQWSGQLTATMLSLLMTIKLHKLNPRTWLSAYLNTCAEAGNRAPAEVSAFLPWTMSTPQLAAMRAGAPHRPSAQPEGYDSS